MDNVGVIQLFSTRYTPAMWKTRHCLSSAFVVFQHLPRVSTFSVSPKKWGCGKGFCGGEVIHGYPPSFSPVEKPGLPKKLLPHLSPRRSPVSPRLSPILPPADNQCGKARGKSVDYPRKPAPVTGKSLKLSTNVESRGCLGRFPTANTGRSNVSWKAGRGSCGNATATSVAN